MKPRSRILAILLAFSLCFNSSIFALPAAAASTAATPISRGEFVAEVTAFFGWPHWDEYNDVWKDDPRTFTDIQGHQYQRAIETAFEEGVIGPDNFVATRGGLTYAQNTATFAQDGTLQKLYGSEDYPNSGGNFNPNGALTIGAAADILAKAFKLYTVSQDTNARILALAELGLDNFPNTAQVTAPGFDPDDEMERNDALALFTEMKNKVVAPVYFLPRATEAGYAPRRNVKLYTANPEAIIFVTRSAFGSYIIDPDTSVKEQRYVEYEVLDSGSRTSDNESDDNPTGYLGYATSGQNPTIKAVAVDETKTLLSESAVAEDTWWLHRPGKAAFQADVIFAKDHFGAGSPKVVRIMNEEGQFAPMAWYIEGSDHAIMFETLQTVVGKTLPEGTTLRDFIVDHVASAHIKADANNKISLVVGHNHPDHVAQNDVFQGHDAYVSPVFSNFGSSWSPADQARIFNLYDGDTLDLGDATLYAYPLPGHEHGLITLQHKESGMVFATDIYGCTRTGTADDVAVAGVKSDMMLSLIQQTHSKYNSGGGSMTYLFTGHDESTLEQKNFLIYEEAFQLLIDEGYEAVTHASHRNSRIGANTRTLTLGDLYPNSSSGIMVDPTITAAQFNALNVTDPTPTVPIPAHRVYRGPTEWISITFGGPAVGSNAAPDYLSSNADGLNGWSLIPPGTNYNTANAADGADTYSQLSNIEFDGADLVGVTFQWSSNVLHTISDMFHPWQYDYSILVEPGTSSITVRPTAMATQATSIKVNGTLVDYDTARYTGVSVPVSFGASFEIEVVAPNGTDTSTYTFTVEDYPAPTPITQASTAPTTIGSYQLRNGYFTHSVTVDNVSREVEVYIPDGARQREYWIGITLPEGVESNEFLYDAGWFDIADETLACLLIMKPDQSGHWGDVEDELAYVNAAMLTLVSSGPFYSAFTYHYLVGYGEGAPALQLWAAQNPLRMISQVYVNAPADADFMTRLNAAGNTQVGATPQPNHMDFEGYTDLNGDPLTTVRTFEAQYNKDVVIPTWLAGTVNGDLIAYWQGVNDTLATSAATSYYGRVYWQDKANSDAISTSYSDVRTQVAVRGGIMDMNDPVLTANINAFLTYYSGYDNNSVYSKFITERLDYKSAIASGNLVYADHMWGDTNRTYIVYVPDSVKSSYDLNNPAPVVMATHGAGQTAMVFLEATDIKEAAEKYGFIAVTFDLTGNAQYMVDLIELVKADSRSLGVAVDDSRIYAYGQSAGGGSVANTYAQSALTVELFAAFGSTSGTQATAQTNGSQLLVPFYAIYGEYDYWPMKLGAVGAGDWRGSMANGSQHGWTIGTQNYWTNRLLGMSMDQALARPYTLVDGISAHYNAENTSIDLIVNPADGYNRYKTYSWANGNGVPLFVWSQCYGRGHNLTPSDLDQLWENWFSKWQKSSNDQVLLYWEDGVGTGTATWLAQSTGSGDGGGGGGGGGGSATQPSARVSGGGGTVTVTNGTVVITPNDGYRISSITVNGTEVAIPANGRLTGLSNSDVVVVRFEQIETGGAVRLPFTDVPANAWYYAAVEFAYEHNIMSGTGAASFDPTAPLTRATMVQVLYNLEDISYSGASAFSDISGGDWFAQAVAWAAEKGIVNGIGDNLFAPNASITREQMAVILYNYCQYKGIGLPEIRDGASFTDAASISSWANEAVSAMYRAGILSGKTGGAFDPQGNATRAEIAQMFMNFMEAID